MQINGKTQIAGVIGYPIAHSKSPLIHNYWLYQHSINGVYVPMEVSPDYLEAALRGLPALGIKGINATIPHKENLLPLMDHLEDTAKQIGAVNTVIVNEDGSFTGKNTDAYGFITNLTMEVPTLILEDKTALLLGAGGASRAIIYGLLQENIEKILLVNRSQDKADQLQEVFGSKVEVYPWQSRNKLMEGADIVINATSLGMQGKPMLDISLDGLAKEAVVTDIVYAPLMTELLVAACARGNPVVTGIGMLLYQAVPGFESWFHVKPEVTEALQQRVLA